jgi:acyl carrier protein
MPLFGDDGLGLDSIDALELVLALKKKYQLVLEANDPATRENLASVAALARLINSRQA